MRCMCWAKVWQILFWSCCCLGSLHSISPPSRLSEVLFIFSLHFFKLPLSPQTKLFWPLFPSFSERLLAKIITITLLLNPVEIFILFLKLDHRVVMEPWPFSPFWSTLFRFLLRQKIRGFLLSLHSLFLLKVCSPRSWFYALPRQSHSLSMPGFNYHLYKSGWTRL